MPMGTRRRAVHSRRGINQSTLLLAVVAIAVVMLLPSLSGQLTAKPSVSTFGPTPASAATPYVTGAEVAQNRSLLTLSSPGALNIFAEANGGYRGTTQFVSGGLASAWDEKGHIAAAIAATPEDSNSYTTTDHYYSIAGVGVSGFQYYGELTQKVTPPVEPTTTLTNSFVLKESALVVVVAASGGQNTIALSGISGLVLDANGTGGTWSGVMIGHAQLKAGTYAETMTSTNHDAGGSNRVDMLGVFAFASSQKGFIDKGLIQVGSGPVGVLYDPAQGEIFVSNARADSVSVINDTTDHVVAIVSVGNSGPSINRGPLLILAYDSGKGEIFVTNYGSDNVTVISAADNSVVANIAVGTQPYGIAYDPEFGEVFVANSQSDTVSVINDTTNHVVANITVSGQPCGLAYDSSNGDLYVSVIYGQGHVAVISPVTNAIVVSSIVVGPYPYVVGYDSGMKEVVVTNFDNTVSLISSATNKVVATIGVPEGPWGISYDSRTGEILIASQVANLTSEISDATHTVVGSIPVGVWPTGIAYDSAKGEIFVANEDSNDIDVFSDGTR
jgi:YVTN family beta-propeller protein